MSNNLFCLRCKKATPTKDLQSVKTKNGRTMHKGSCSVCHANKAQFVAAAAHSKVIKGKGAVSDWFSSIF